tara:strand:- start:1492 stop:2652 length:1161 start_codon:yes stop_codon:yes gene_type:complete
MIQDIQHNDKIVISEEIAYSLPKQVGQLEGCDMFAKLLKKKRQKEIVDIDVNEPLPNLAVKTCANCGESLTGVFCMACGQKDTILQRPFWTLIEDTLGDLFSFDSRLSATLIPLFFKPGYVTREFNLGRRTRFVPPFRQYLAISVIFFLLLVSVDIQLFEDKSDPSKTDASPASANVKLTMNGAPVGQETTDQPAPLMTAPLKNVDAEDLSPEILDEVTERMTKNREENLKNSTETEKQLYDRSVSLMSGIKKVWADPKLLNVVIANWTPKMMFVMLPLFAILLKLFYIRRKKYYIEHLVFSLYFHGFIFLLFTAMLLLYQFVPQSDGYLDVMLWYIPVYLYLALWRVYQQGPIKTFFKTALISMFYVILLSTGLTIAIGYGLSEV